jgi:hypothetical protein
MTDWDEPQFLTKKASSLPLAVPLLLSAKIPRQPIPHTQSESASAWYTPDLSATPGGTSECILLPHQHKSCELLGTKRSDILNSKTSFPHRRVG